MRSYIDDNTLAGTQADSDNRDFRGPDIDIYSDSGSGIPLSDGSILTVVHARTALFGRSFIIDGVEFRPRPNYIIFHDSASSKRYNITTDNEGLSEDGLFRFSVPEAKQFPRSFEFDLGKNPHRMTNDEFDEKYPPGTRVMISGYVRHDSLDDLSSQVEVVSTSREDDIFVLQRITTYLAPRDGFDWVPNRNDDFLYFLVPGGVELRGMSGGPITTTDADGVERLIGVSFLRMRMPLRIFGRSRFLGLYFYPRGDAGTPQVLVGFIWPFDSAEVANPRKEAKARARQPG